MKRIRSGSYEEMKVAHIIPRRGKLGKVIFRVFLNIAPVCVTGKM